MHSHAGELIDNVTTNTLKYTEEKVSATLSYIGVRQTVLCLLLLVLGLYVCDAVSITQYKSGRWQPTRLAPC